MVAYSPHEQSTSWGASIIMGDYGPGGSALFGDLVKLNTLMGGSAAGMIGGTSLGILGAGHGLGALAGHFGMKKTQGALQVGANMFGGGFIDLARMGAPGHRTAEQAVSGAFKYWAQGGNINRFAVGAGGATIDLATSGGHAAAMSKARGGMRSRMMEKIYSNTIYKRTYNTAGESLSMMQANRLISKQATSIVAKNLFKEGGMKAIAAGARTMGIARFGVGLGMRAIPVVGWAWLATDVARGAIHGMDALDDLYQSTRHKLRSPNLTDRLAETSFAQTERQRAMMSIQQSHLNARSAFGSEARRFH